MPATKHATREENEARVDVLFTLLVNGASDKECLQYCRQKWGLERAVSYLYLARAREEIKSNRAIDKEYELARELLRRDSLYKTAIQKEGVRSALAVADSRCALLGLFAPERHKVELSQKENAFEHLTKEEARFALETLESVLPRDIREDSARTQGRPKREKKTATK